MWFATFVRVGHSILEEDKQHGLNDSRWERERLLLAVSLVGIRVCHVELCAVTPQFLACLLNSYRWGEHMFKVRLSSDSCLVATELLVCALLCLQRHEHTWPMLQ
jgi:hypothetical protein